MNLVKVWETSLFTKTVIVLHVRSERVEVPFERVEFRWNYLIIMSEKANNSNVGARTLIDIFSKY